MRIKYPRRMQMSIFHRLFVCVIAYIRDHVYEKLTVNHIAQELHFSRSYLCHIYKLETGQTLSDRIRHEKISEAKFLLQYSSFSLTDIAHKLGFCSQSHFTYVFRKETE